MTRVVWPTKLDYKITMENVNPEVFKATKARPTLPEECIDDVDDEIDCREIFGK